MRAWITQGFVFVLLAALIGCSSAGRELIQDTGSYRKATSPDDKTQPVTYTHALPLSLTDKPLQKVAIDIDHSMAANQQLKLNLRFNSGALQAFSLLSFDLSGSCHNPLGELRVDLLNPQGVAIKGVQTLQIYELTPNLSYTLQIAGAPGVCDRLHLHLLAWAGTAHEDPVPARICSVQGSTLTYYDLFDPDRPRSYIGSSPLKSSLYLGPSSVCGEEVTNVERDCQLSLPNYNRLCHYTLADGSSYDSQTLFFASGTAGSVTCEKDSKPLQTEALESCSDQVVNAETFATEN